MGIILAILVISVGLWIGLFINVLVGYGRRGLNPTAPRWARHCFPRSVVGRGPSRRAQKRALHCQRVSHSRLSNPGLGGLSVLLSSSRALLRVVERGLAEAEAGATALVSTDWMARSVMAERVSSMGNGRLNKAINRLKGQVGEDVSSRLAKRTERRRNRRQARVALKQMNRVAAFNQAVARFSAAEKSLSVKEESTEEWALTCAAIWAGSSHNPKNQRGKVNLRCIEGSRQFESAGRARSAAKLWVHKPVEDRESLIEKGQIVPSVLEERDSSRQELINKGHIRPVCQVSYYSSEKSGMVALCEAA